MTLQYELLIGWYPKINLFLKKATIIYVMCRSYICVDGFSASLSQLRDTIRKKKNINECLVFQDLLIIRCFKFKNVFLQK